MKKNFFIRFLPALLLWLLPAIVFAAEPDLIITTSVTDGAIVACGNEQEVTVKIKNNTLNSITLNGLNLFSTTTTQIQVVTPLPSGWKNTGCATGYIYCPTSTTSIIPSQILTLTFKVKAGCDIIAAVESGKQNFFDVKVLYNTSLIATQTSVNPVNILSPNYSLTVTPDGAVAYGETVIRTITVCNLGNGFNPALTITHAHDAGLQWLGATYEIQSPDNTVLSSGTAAHGGAGNTDTYTITDNNPEVISDPSDQKRCYVVSETLKVTGCAPINSTYTTTWGCNSQTCKSVSKTNLLIVKPQFPAMNVIEQAFTQPDFCTPGKVVYQIHNYGDDPAGNIVFDLPYSSTVVLTNAKILLDDNGVTSVPLAAPTGSPYHVDISSLTAPALVNSALGTQLINGKLFLNGHSAIFISFDVKYNCPTGGGSVVYNIGPGTLNYKDVCGTTKPTEILDLNEAKVSWGTCGARFTPDMKVGDIQKLKICYEASTSQIPCPNGEYTATYTLPTGLVYQSATALIDGNPYANVSVNGNIVTFNGIGTYQGLKCFEISVKLTCDGTSGGPVIKEFLSTFKLSYKCDKNSSCCDIVAGTYPFKVFGDMTGCPNVSSPNCLQTTSFTTKRNTFGINPLTGLPANASTAGIALDRAYPCDEILACAKGKWISTGATLLPSNAFINVEFEQQASILQFVSGTIEIVDASGNLLTSCTAAAPAITISGTKYTQRFTLPTACGTTLQPNYGINLCAKYKVLDDASIGHGPILSVFRTTFGYKNAGVDVTCWGKGDQMTLIRPINTVKLSTSPTKYKAQCDPVKVTMTWTTETCFDDDFPNEIRNINQFSTYKFNYPTGFNLLDANYVNVTCSGTTTTPIKGLPPGSVNCTHPFTVVPTFPLIDKCSNYMQQRLEFNLQPTCLAPENGTVSMDVTYKNFPGSTCEKLETKSLTLPLLNNTPKLVVNTMPPTIDGTSDQACWTIRVYNGSYEVIANQVSLKFPACSGITILSIADITNGNYEDLTANLVNGQLPIGTFYSRDERIYQVCGTYKCTNNTCPVEVSSSCGVPYYCTSTTIPQVCTASQTTMTATPKDGLLQTVFDVPTEVPDVCQDLEMSYVITNSGAGALYDIITKITSFPSCWKMVANSVCVQSTKPNSRKICLPEFDLIAGVDLGGIMPGDWGTRVFFKIQTTCAMLNCTAASIVMQTTGKKACGDIYTNTFTSKNMVFTSKPDYSYDPTITAEPFTYCTATDLSGTPAKDGISTITFNLLVKGPFVNTVPGDLIAINIPAGFQYVTSSFTTPGVGNVTVVGSTNNCTTGSKVNLKINSVVGIGGIINFKLNVIRCSAIDLPCGSYKFSCSITQNDTRTCTSPVLNCVIGDGKVTVDKEFMVDVKKPTFAVTNVVEVTPLALCGANGKVKFTLTNMAGLPLAATDQVPVDIYCSTTGCQSFLCGSSLPAGVTLLKTELAQPGAYASIDITTTITSMCKTGTHLYFRVGLSGTTCSPAICFCPTNYCHPLARPTVDFTVSNICKGTNPCIVNTSNSLGQAATYVATLKSPTGTTIYTSGTTFCVTPAQTNLAVGTYTWILSQTTACGTITQQKTFTISAVPTVTVSPTAVSICPGTPTTLTASGATTYSWLPVTGLTSSTVAVVGANPPTTTTYTVTGTTAGCSATATTKVTVNPPVVVAIPDEVVCLNSCKILSYTNIRSYISGGTPATGNPYDIVIKDPNGTTVYNCPKGNSQCATPLSLCATGTYTITATDSKGCSASDQFTISTRTCCEALCGKLSPDGAPDGHGSMMPPAILCQTQPVTIDWSCNLNSGPVLVIVREVQDPKYTFISPSGAAPTQAFRYNSYLQVPTDLRTDFSFLPNRWYEVQLRADVGWTCGEGAPGIYMYFKNKDCVKCTTSFTTNISGISDAVAVQYCYVSAPKTVPVSSSTSGYASGTAPTYAWTNKPYTISSPGVQTLNSPINGTSTSLTLSTPNLGYDSGFLVFTVIDNLGCRATSAVLYHYSAGAGMKPAETSTIEEIKNEDLFNVMPNPNNGSFTILVDLESEKNVSIYDMTGKIVFEKTKTKDQSFKVDITHLTKGIYLVKVSDGKNYEIKKVVVQ